MASESGGFAVAAFEPLGLGLHERVDEFSSLLLSAVADHVPGEHWAWLQRRYREIVPLVLPAALRAVELGELLSVECLEKLRGVAARSAADPEVRLGVALRGAVPALRVFSLVLQTSTRIDARCAVLAMARATHVAHELGSCWIEAWTGHLSPPTAGPSLQMAAHDAGDVSRPPGPVELVVVDSELEEAEERMLTLTAYGLSNEGIAKATSYSKQAVGWHLSRLMKAWKAPNRTALVTMAFVKGVIVPRVPRTRSRRALEAPPLPSEPFD
ncbi:LuxR C-terminal-related transcriptional regulator [Rathayibacter sp. VKM Ac-2927]|uniref:helix-turn-helix transcriptional regulator n=1 Tax=Rathayibacter sp. VKM Ac-2927 TaxID=2929478 RepID=UPI001FB3BE26|nr:LuxR C-terminal-related transcriptional regulator [Rathayibacter sp. VKM Ac-2927]MCJ1688455.1 LuxR C-terminal-related transcriptional regulator [Rathayibacter sp. VKM Ac-2927]